MEAPSLLGCNRPAHFRYHLYDLPKRAPMPPRAPQYVSLAMAERLLKKAATPPEWQLTAEQFQFALQQSAAHRFSNSPANDRVVLSYLEGLQLGDLAIAHACNLGVEAAWDSFVAQFRSELYRAARAIAGESASRELADTLYADLYGLRETEGRRNSLFHYFHGRSKLTTWLHAILAQRRVDDFRRTRKMEPLEDSTGNDRELPATSNSSPSKSSPDPERNRYLAMLQAALTAALCALAPRDRLRLAYYYVEELTLAEIGRLLREHEATASRKLERTRRDLRRTVESMLREEKKLNDAQLRLCFEYARQEWPFDLTRALSARD